MKNIVKRILSVFAIIVVIWIAFIVLDCGRLKNSKTIENKPLITINSSYTDNRQRYDGLGYSIAYYINDDNSIYGSEFRLFNKLLIWGWVE